MEDPLRKNGAGEPSLLVIVTAKENNICYKGIVVIDWSLNVV